MGTNNSHAQLKNWETIASLYFISFPCYFKAVSWEVTCTQSQIWCLPAFLSGFKGHFYFFVPHKLKHCQQGYHFIAVEMLSFIFCDVILHSPDLSCA